MLTTPDGTKTSAHPGGVCLDRESSALRDRARRSACARSEFSHGVVRRAGVVGGGPVRMVRMAPSGRA